MDFGLSESSGKTLVLTANQMFDLSEYGLGIANNGQGTDGQSTLFLRLVFQQVNI